MSRSYRAPWYTDGYKGSRNRQYHKREANRTIRRSIDVPNGKAYRKFYESWSICDYKFPMLTPYIRWSFFKNEFEWVYEERPWRVCRK